MEEAQWHLLALPFIEQGVIGVLLLVLILYLFKLAKIHKEERQVWRETAERQHKEIATVSDRSIEVLTEIKTMMKSKR